MSDDATPRAIIFDLDKTLAESKAAMTPAMGALLAKLLARMPVAIISGAKFSQFQEQVLPFIPVHLYTQLYLIPTSGAALYHFENGSWKTLYEETIEHSEADRISSLLEETARSTKILTGNEPSLGTRIEFRGSQVTFSALGQSAPLLEKEQWDPDKSKRLQLRSALIPLLPDYEIALGGSTSIDVVRRGINKAYGVKKLETFLGIPVTHMLYVGDDLQEGGNDAIVKTTGIRTYDVNNPTDTAQLIERMVSDF